MNRLLLYVAIFVLAVVIIPYLGIHYLDHYLDVDISGWLQTGIALVSFPVILYELNQIRQSVNQKPQIEIGVVNINDLPFSNTRQLKQLPTKIEVSQGYAHFYLILRNGGAAPARYVKVYVEHVNRSIKVNAPPLVKPSEFSEKKASFVSEHNFDFVFRAGNDWIINTDDIEPFSFHITTPIIIRDIDGAGNEFERHAYPSPCTVELNCTVWADGLDHPLATKLFVTIVEHRATK